MDNMTAISSWSGGKDSCLACYKAIQKGYKIKHLLHFVSRESKRSCFHGIENRLMQLQAEALGINMIQKEVSPDMAKYESEFKEAVSKLKTEGIATMVFGDIYLLDHANWVERVCKELGITAVEPLWNNPAEAVLEEFINLGFKAVVVSCQADKFGSEFIGREVNRELLEYLVSRNICPCGENGEFHTFVTDGPMFKKCIRIVESESVLKEGFWKHWFLDIKKYKLFEKLT
jgi:uncharacterized protein (TIGR00290 family)